MSVPAIVTTQRGFNHPIFKNDLFQGISIISGIVLTIGTIWYFVNEAKSSKKEIEKNNLEIKKLNEEIIQLMAKRNGAK